MDIDRTLFAKEGMERLEAELVDKAKMVMDSDSTLAMTNLFQLIQGLAGHLTEGMIAVGFPEAEAETQAWLAAWGKLRTLLDSETWFGHEVATYIERNISLINPDTQTSESGEPLDAATRNFYRTFLDYVEHPAVHQTAAWLYEEI